MARKVIQQNRPQAMHGGGCGAFSVDDKRWPHQLHEAGEIMPGTRTIKCGGEIDIEIKPGNIYYFNYWGP